MGKHVSILALLIASAVYATAAPSRNRRFENDSTGIELVRHGPKPVPIPISARELYEREDIRRRLVSVEGTVHDAFHVTQRRELYHIPHEQRNTKALQSTQN